jgi:hypothetical protein
MHHQHFVTHAGKPPEKMTRVEGCAAILIRQTRLRGAIVGMTDG